MIHLVIITYPFLGEHPVPRALYRVILLFSNQEENTKPDEKRVEQANEPW